MPISQTFLNHELFFFPLALSCMGALSVVDVLAKNKPMIYRSIRHGAPVSAFIFGKMIAAIPFVAYNAVSSIINCRLQAQATDFSSFPPQLMFTAVWMVFGIPGNSMRWLLLNICIALVGSGLCHAVSGAVSYANGPITVVLIALAASALNGGNPSLAEVSRMDGFTLLGLYS